jgi:subfamily B ATP-binding cassette protein MsbA
MPQPKENRVTMAHVFKTIIWPRRRHLFLGLFLIIISRLSGLILPGASKISHR